MKKYYEFLRYIKENNIDSDAPLVVVYRESALSDIQELDLIVTGNAIQATDNAENLNIKGKVQFNLTKVGDLNNLIELSQQDNKNRILTFRSMAIKNEDATINLTLNLGNTFYTGYNVKGFEFINNKLLVDITR